MAKDYVSTYRRLLKTRSSGARPRQLALNGGNGLTPISIEKPFAALFEADRIPRFQSEKRRIVLAKNRDHRCAAHSVTTSRRIRTGVPSRRAERGLRYGVGTVIAAHE